MADAVVEERHLVKSLRWWDGFAIAMCNPGFLFASLGFTLGVFGVMGSVILWGISALIGLVLTWIYIEPAMMFPNQSGGISLYANEAWRKYTTFVGPIATFGYWIGWSVVLSIFGGIVGTMCGIAIALTIAAFTPIPAAVEIWSVALGIGITAFVGLFFGLYPALRAARLDPIEALRRE